MRMRRVGVVKAKVDVARNFAARFACSHILSYLSPPFPIILATPLHYNQGMQYWRRCELWLYQGVKSGYILA